jgi:hypothetical protein
VVRWGWPCGGAGPREVDARYLRGTWQVDQGHQFGRQVPVVLARQVTQCAICMRCAGIGCLADSAGVLSSPGGSAASSGAPVPRSSWRLAPTHTWDRERLSAETIDLLCADGTGDPRAPYNGRRPVRKTRRSSSRTWPRGAGTNCKPSWPSTPRWRSHARPQRSGSSSALTVTTPRAVTDQ